MTSQKEYTTEATYNLFSDGFESQNLSAWSSSVTNNGALSVTSAAHLIDDYGMKATLGTAAIYVENTTPNGLWQYRARLWFDPNSVAMTTGTETIFEGRNGTNAQFQIELQKSGADYQLRARIRNDANGWSNSGWQTITDAPHSVDVYWAAATGAGANNGYVKLSIDGLFRQQVTGVDNDTLRLEEARLGAASTPPSGMSGTLYFDGFQSWGALPAPYRAAEYEYVTNTLPSVWILDRVRRQTLKDTNGNTIAEQLYAYDGTAAGIGTKGDLTFQQVVNPITNQSMDAANVYDSFGYGNITKTCAYTGYGTPGALPATLCSAASGPFRATTVTFDPAADPTYTFPKSTTDPAGQTTTTTYRYDLGLPVTVTDPNNAVTTTAYDGLGRVTDITYPGYASPGYNPSPNYTGANVKYDYPDVISGTVSSPFGLKLEAWDETANVYRSAWTIYDALGRALQVQGPAETSGNLIVVDTKYNALGQTEYSGLPRLVTGTGGSHFAPDWGTMPHSTTVYDALGRATSVQLADGSTQSTSYNGWRTTGVDQNGHQKVQEVDAFGRLVKVEEYTGTAAGGYQLYAVTGYQYDLRDLLTQVTDAQGNITTVLYDGFGRKTGMTDPDMGTWGYGYDPLGNLISQTDARNITLSFEYDSLNRLTKKWQGAIGTGTLLATYAYDAGTNGLGHRTSMVDANSTTTWTYNALGQVKDTTWLIGGALTYKTCSTYDAFGRLLTQRIPSTSNCTGELLNYNYNATGALESVSGTAAYVTNMDYNASGQVTSTVLGNGVTTISAYDPLSLRLTSAVSAKIPQTPVLSLAYLYDSVGNITQWTDGTRNEITNYQYDDLDRLTRATATQNNSVLYERTWSYDLIGNITTLGVWPSAPGNYMSGSFGGASLNTTNNNRGRISAFTSGSYSPFTKGSLGPVSASGSNAGRASFASGALNTTTGTRGSITAFTNGVAVLPFTKGPGGAYLPNPPQGWAYTTYNYSNSAHKHAVTGLSSGETYSYDANGNMTQRVEGGLTYTQNFNAENQLTSVTVSGQTTSFYYDPDGNLLGKVKPDGSGTLYLGGLYEVDLTSVGVTTKKTSYYPGGAMRVDIVGGPNTLYYSLRDHLGSASTLLDASGNLVTNGEQRYYPFGESRLTSADLKTDHLFTGQLSVGLGGIYHYGARMYSPRLGRFLSADTIVPEPSDPQALNRFSYTYNNPVKYIDPSGHDPSELDACNGTSFYISKRTGDGGISQADCWAAQAGNRPNDSDFACVAGSGCFDLGHADRFGANPFGSLEDKWKDFQKRADTARDNGDNFFIFEFSSDFHNAGSVIVTYWVNAKMEQAQQAGVFIGMFMDFAYRFESAELFLGFNAADLPSDYLGAVAATKGRPATSLLYELGGAVTFYKDDPYSGTSVTHPNYEFTPVEKIGRGWYRREWSQALQVGVINDPKLWGPIAESKSYLHRVTFYTVYAAYETPQ